MYIGNTETAIVHIPTTTTKLRAVGHPQIEGFNNIALGEYRGAS